MLSCHEPINDGLLRVGWKRIFLDHELVQIISKEISACSSTMTIIHSEERALWPFFLGAMSRLHYVKNDGHSVFVVVPYDSLVGVGCVRPYYSISSDRALGRVIVRNGNLMARLPSH